MGATMDEAGKDQLRAAFEARGLTLTDIADACGISRSAVANWFLSGRGWRPIPERHMATIRELLGAQDQGGPGSHVPAGTGAPHPTELDSAGVPPARVEAPAAARRPARRGLARTPARRSPMHYPGHWTSPPVTPTPSVADAAGLGPQHSDFVAEHNYASQHGEVRDVRFARWPI